MIIISIIIISIISLSTDGYKEVGDFYIYKGLPVIDVDINGNKTKLLIDTGSTSSFLDLNSSSELGFQYTMIGSGVTGVNGTTNVGLVKNVKVLINEKRTNIKFKTVDLKAIDRLNVSGILGNDYFVKNNLVIDYEEKRIKKKR